jgi:hypothetical protein
VYFRIGNPEKAGLSPPGSPAVLADKVLLSVIIPNEQNPVIAGQASGHIMIDTTGVTEEILIDGHGRGQGSIVIKSGLEGGFIGINI